MEIAEQEGGKVVAAVGERVILSALIGRIGLATPGLSGEGVLVVTDLDGSGSIEEIEEAAKLLRELVDDEDLYLGVRLDHPRFEAVIRLYEMLGAKGEMVVMKLGGK